MPLVSAAVHGKNNRLRKIRLRVSRNLRKFSGDIGDLMKSIKKNYSDDKWSQRMALVNSGKCVNTESHENDKLFKNDRATNANDGGVALV